MITKKSIDGGNLFHVLALGLSMNILSGALDAQKDSPGYKQLLDRFAEYHPNFEPKTWDNLKEWLEYYNSPRDIAIILAPVLSRLNQNLVSLTKEEINNLFAIECPEPINSVNGAQNLADVSRMAAVLNFDVLDSEPDLGAEQANKNKATIHVRYDDQRWYVLADEALFLSINRYDEQLQKTPLNQSIQNGIKVEAPQKSSLEDLDSLKVELRQKVVDNPGNGDCAFYAFAIALIHIIKEESTYSNKKMFDRWVALDPSIEQDFATICSYNFDRVDRELLYRLQRSLRTITYDQQLDELKRACSDRGNSDAENLYKVITGNSVYGKFAELYYDPSADRGFNELAGSKPVLDAILAIDRNTVKENFEHLTLVPVFLSLIYGKDVDPKSITFDQKLDDNSPIAQVMAVITQDSFWGTHLSLDYLARAFEVNFHPLRNGQPLQKFVADQEGLHTVTINNWYDAHWTTQMDDVVIFDSKRLEAERLAAEAKRAEAERLAAEQSTQQHDDKPKDQETVGHGNKPKNKKKVRFSLTEEQQQVARQVIVPNSEKTVAASVEERRQMEFLRDVATKATISYVDYSSNIWFSLFHRHGQSGRVRAQNFYSEFLAIDDLDEAKTFLVAFLSDSSNGNTHSHSFRTMLLNGLLKDPKPTLQNTSEHFDEQLAEVSHVLDVNRELLNHSSKS